ncbi:chloride channel protein [Candidatus Bathyarchaeota archaeon]|nr:chloride channel protein [Candidatus Bathyarchaeota archaeon]
MSKFSDNITYYVLVGATGLVSAALAIALYVVYTELWAFTIGAIGFSTFLVIPLAFAAVVASYFLVKRFAKTKTTGSGTHTVLEAYHLTNGAVSFRDTVIKPIAGMLTIGLGGSAGPEGPSLLAGGGVASQIGKHLKVRSDLRRRLFVAGAAAGLAAIFRTPLTGILFALEIPYKNDLDRETFIEAIISSIPAYLLSVAILGAEPIFGNIPSPALTLDVIGLSLLLGSICGLYAVFFTKAFTFANQLGVKLRTKYGDAVVVSLCALSIAASGLISIYSIGVGLHFVNALISGAGFSIAALIAIILLKTFITTTTLNWGGSGGLFFPTIVIGAGLGYIFAQVLSVNLAVMFIAVGMAALLAGTHKILLTPVAFVIETLGGVFAIPALLASGISYVLSGKASFYPLQPHTKLKTEGLALERFYLRGQKVVPNELKATEAAEFMTANPYLLYKGTTVKAAVETFEEHNLRVMPVIDESSHVVGVVNLEDLGYIDVRQQDAELPETIFHKPTLIKANTSLEAVARLMMDNEEDHVFVVDEEDQLIGVVSGIDVVKKILELTASYGKLSKQ